MADYVEQTASTRLAGFIEKRKVAFITVLIVIVCLLTGFIIASVILNNSKEKDLQAIDEITYTLTSNSSSLEESEIELRRQTAIEQTAVYTMKGGIVGARANMLCADLTFQQKKYEDSASYWKNAASKAKKSYIAPIAYFNLGVCYEELNNLDAAAENYKLAADNDSFLLRTHAKFSYARVLETQGKYENAVEAYKDLTENHSGNEWANLAKTRLIALQNAGKAE